MLLKSDIRRILVDFLRSELLLHQQGAAGVETENDNEFFARLPRAVLKEVFAKVACFFGFEKREFSSLDLMTDYAYASYLKKHSVVFTTSGRMGIARQSVHTEQMLEEEVYGLKPFFKDCKRIVALVPSNHWYGFVLTVYLPRTLGIEVVTLPADASASWEKLLYAGDWVVSVPLFWNCFLRAGNRFAAGVTAVSSMAPCKDEVINHLFGAGLTNFIEIYGSGETGSMGVRTHAGAAFELLNFWEVSRRADTPKFKRKSQPEWLLIPDELAFISDRLIRPLRRKENCVEIAGEKIYPKQIEDILLQHPAVNRCRVRLMRPEEGDQLKAFVVLKEGYTPAHEGIIRSYLLQKLTANQMPRSFTFGAELPTAAVGKESDW